MFFSMISAVLMILIVRMLGPHEFGRLSLFVQMAVTTGLFLSWGSSGTLAKFLPEQKSLENQVRLSSQFMEISFFSAVIVSAGFMITAALVPGKIPIEIRSEKFVFIVFIFLFALFNVLQGIFRGLGKFIHWSIIEGSNDALSRFLAIGLILWFGSSYKLVLYCYTVVLSSMVIYGFWATKKQYRLTSLRMHPELTKFSGMMLVGTAVFMVGTSCDAVLLRALLKDSKEVGYYFAGVRIPQIFQSLMLAHLSIPFIYYFTHPDTLHTRDQVIRVGTKMLGVICGLGSLFLFSYGGIIVQIFYGKFYMESIPVLKIYGLIFFVMGLQTLCGPFYMAINKIYLPTIIGIISVLLLAALDFYMIPRWRSAGAAAANVIMLVVQDIAHVLCLYFLSGKQINTIRPTLILMAGVILSILLELFWLRYSAVPFFALFVIGSHLFSKEEIRKINDVMSVKVTEVLI